MSSLVIINSAPNLSRWQRQVEKTRAQSHSAEVAHGRKTDAKSSSDSLKPVQRYASPRQPADQSSSGASSSREKSIVLLNDRTEAATLPFILSRHGRKSKEIVANRRHSRSLTETLRSSDMLCPFATDNDNEGIHEELRNDEVEELVSNAVFMNDFGCYRGMRTDPFGVFSKFAAPAVDYYSQIIVPSYTAIWKIFDVNSMVPQTLFELLDTKVCLLPMILPPKIITDPTWFPGKRLSQSFLEGYNIALSNVRQRIKLLGGRADAATLMAVNGLAILAGAMGDIPTFKIHAQSLEPLLRSAGGFEALGRFGFIKSLLLQWESQWAYQPHMRVTIFPNARARYVAEYPTMPFPTEVERLVTKLPEGFQELARKGELSRRTLEILGRCADVSSDHVLPGAREQYHSGHRRFADFFEASPCIMPGQEGPSPLEKLVMQALILYCVHTWSPLRFDWGLYRGIRMDLTAEVNRRPLDVDHERRVMVWICMNLIDSWQSSEGSGRLTAQGRGIMDRLSVICGPIMAVTQITSCIELFFQAEKFMRNCEKCLSLAIAEKTVHLDDRV